VARRPTLVVGTGLTGAALAYVMARSGIRTIVISVDRPASQGTALASGIVHGLGPPGEPYGWARMPASAHAQAAERSRRGYELLREVLFAAPRACGLARIEHSLEPPLSGDADWLERTLGLLVAGGWPVDVRERPGGAVLVRRSDALVDPRRLTFELLRQARAAGSRIMLGTPFRGIVRECDGGLVVHVGTESIEVERVLWAAGRAFPDGARPVPARPRLVLHQLLGPGRSPLTSILEQGDGNLQFTPDALRPGHAVLVRIADENPAGGLVWPELPREWEPLRGPAIRQRLAETVVTPPDRPFTRSGPMVAVAGLSAWPVTALLGTCWEAARAEEVLS
jgi:glycine/D-amino acid oxidase-like deaminating enzyme